MKQSWENLGTYSVAGGKATLTRSDHGQLRLDLPPDYVIVEVRTFATATQVRLARVIPAEHDET